MKLDDLPKENLIRIFSFLELHDLIQKRLVNKRWSSIIATEMQFNELNIMDVFSTGKNLWYYTAEPLNFQFRLNHYESDPLPNSFYRSPLFQSMFGELKKLRLSCLLSENNGFQLEALNDLQSLRHLDIYSISINGKKTLSLANLEILSISKFYLADNEKNIVLTVCAKKLKSLYYGFCLDTVQFVYPSSLTYISTNYRSNVANLNVFVNLEILVCSNLRVDDFSDEINFDGLRRLKEVHFFQIKFNYYEQNRETLHRYKRFFSGLRNNRRSSKPLMISFQGIRLDSDEQFDRCDFLSTHVNLQLENYPSLIDKLPWYKQVNYNEVMRASRGSLPSDFFQRFYNIQLVMAKNQIPDYLSFLLFLTKCINLRSLALCFVQIDPAFYTHLPKIYNLTNLSIQALPNEVIDYSFVTQLRYLTALDTNQTLSLRFVVRAFKESPYYLESISFRTRDDCYLLDKTGKNTYYLECYENTKERTLVFLKKNMCLRKLSEFCKDLENRNLIINRPNKKQKID